MPPATFFIHVLTLLLSLVFGAEAGASDLIVSREVFEDPTGTLTLEQVERAAFQPMDISLSEGFTDSAFWIRLRIRPPTPSNKTVLRIRLHNLDEIRLYEPDPARPGRWNSRVTGDRYPYEQRDIPAIPFEFEIRPGAPDTLYYLRIKSTTALIATIEALEPQVADRKNNRLGMALFCYFAVMFFLLFWSIHDYAENRQTVAALYILYQSVYILYSLAGAGYIAVIVPNEFPQLADYINNALICSAVFVTLLFHRTLFELFAPPQILMRGFNLLLPVYPLQLGAMIFDHTRLAMQTNAALLLLAAPYFLVLAVFARRQTAPGLTVLRWVYSFHALFILLLIGMVLGFLSNVLPHWNGIYVLLLFIQGLTASSVGFVMTHLRARQLIEKRQQALRLANAAYNNTQEGICITDLNTRIIAVNPAFCTITEYSEDEVIGQTNNLLSSGKHDSDFFRGMWNSILNTGRWQGEIWDRRKNGEIFPLWLSISTIHDDAGNPINYVGIFNDITRIRHVETPLERLAYYDTLTDLPNRKLLTMRLNHALSRSVRTGNRGSVLFLDLDRFKPVNDTYGHATGDELLQQIAKRLQERLRKADTLARLGGDEFVILLEDLADYREAESVARNVIAIMETPFELSGGQWVEIGCSIGISHFSQNGADPDQLLQQADKALYQAKRSGRGAYRSYRSAVS